MSDKPRFEDPRRVLQRHGLRAKRAFSQNFLTSQHAIDAIVHAVGVEAGERVIELGPGLGTLTAALVRAGAEVVAFDKDRDMLAVLRAELGEWVDIREGDAASLDFAPLRKAAKVAVAGNLPYAITGAILRNLMEQRDAISRAVLMVQREVQERLCASAGDGNYGALSVFTQAAFRVEKVIVVPKGAFHPAPKVESAVIRLIPHSTPRAPETPAFSKTVKAAFGQRRKTLRNSLRAAFDAEGILAALAEVDIDPKRRAETLTVEDFARLAQALDNAAG